MILLILKAHRTLHFSSRIDKLTQRIARQRMVISALVHILKGSGSVEITLGINALKQEPFDLVCRVQRPAIGREHVVRKALQHATQIAGIMPAILVDDLTKYKHLTRPKNVRRHPVECRPVNCKP